MRRIHIILIMLSALLNHSFCQEGIPTQAKTVGIKEYLSAVTKGNIEFIAQKLNISIAEASLKASKVFTDPELAMSYFDNQESQMLLGRGVDAGISYTFNLGNARSARIGLAESEKDLTNLVLNSFYQNLRSRAALVYYTALKEKLLADVSEDTYLRMMELATADSLRLKSGTIMEVDSKQSSVEARIQKNEVIRAKANWQVALVQMARISGITNPADVSQPDGSLEFQIREFSLSWLIDQARANHYDLQVAIQKELISEKTLALIRAGRSPEIGLSTSLAYSSYAKNEIAPSPAHYTYNAGIAIPLKISNLNKGEVEASRLAIEQNKLNFQNTELEIIAQVNQAYIQYESKKRQLEEFHSGLLAESEAILNSKIYSYKRGETSFLDVLNAQRTFNEIRKSFYETHYEYLEALIELESSAGIWDIQ